MGINSLSDEEKNCVCIGVECVFEKLCFRLSEEKRWRWKCEGGRWKGILCLYYLFASFLFAGFYFLRVLFPHHFFHFKSFLSHLYLFYSSSHLVSSFTLLSMFIVDAKMGFSAFSSHSHYLKTFFVVGFGMKGLGPARGGGLK